MFDTIEEEHLLQKEIQSSDLPDNIPQLNSLYIYISGSCNLACRHCWIEPNFISAGGKGKFIPLNLVQKVIKEGIPLGLNSVKLTGGEPTLHPQFRELVKIIDQAGLNISLETNGILVATDLANFLAAIPHLTFISVSLDGADAITHESLRLVPDSFNRTIRSIECLVRVGFHPQIICTLHQGNKLQIRSIIKLANELGCGSIKINHLQNSGRGEFFGKINGLTIPELVEMNNFIEKEMIPYSKASVLFDIPLAFKSLRALLDNNLGCCTILNILGVLPDGKLSLCGIGVTIPELIYGDIGQDFLDDVWKKAPGLITLRRQIPSQLKGICNICIHRDLCLGGCIANNYHDSGVLNSPYFFCDQAKERGLFPVSRQST